MCRIHVLKLFQVFLKQFQQFLKTNYCIVYVLCTAGVGAAPKVDNSETMIFDNLSMFKKADKQYILFIEN